MSNCLLGTLVLVGLLITGCQNTDEPAQSESTNNGTETAYNPEVLLSANSALSGAIGEYVQLAYSPMSSQYPNDANILWVMEKYRVAEFDDKNKCIFFTVVLLNTPSVDAGSGEILLEAIDKTGVQEKVSSFWKSLSEHHLKAESLQKGIEMLDSYKAAKDAAEKQNPSALP